MNFYKQNITFYLVLLFLISIIIFEAQEILAESVCTNSETGKTCNRMLKSKLSQRSQDSINLKDTETIWGGEVTKPHEFPYMVRVGVPIKTRVLWNGGGTLISQKFVLTAAHVATPPAYYSPAKWIRLGEHDTAASSQDTIKVDYLITEIFVHPQYVSFEHRTSRSTTYSTINDIALLKFQGLSTFNEYISPICLNVFENIPNPTLFAHGWGTTQFSARQRNTKLRSVQLDIVSEELCKKIFSKFDNERMLCIGYLLGGKDTCEGDSGGPVVIFENRTECPGAPIYTQIAITSQGVDCASPNTPAMYVRISYFIPWIENIVRNNT